MSAMVGIIRGVFATAVPMTNGGGFETAPEAALHLTLDGIPGDRHAGPTRPAGPREPWLPKGLTLRNDRQLSALSVEDLGAIAAALGIPDAPAELVGANLLLEGIAGLSRLPAGAHLAIGGAWAGKGKFDGAAVLRVEAYNRPCRGPGRKLAARYGRPELELAFPTAAKSLRGLVLSVAAPGVVRPGDAVVVVPPIVAG
jgi:MOSC domain-containing protein YiiM